MNKICYCFDISVNTRTIEHVGTKQMYVNARKEARTQKNFSSDFHEFQYYCGNSQN